MSTAVQPNLFEPESWFAPPVAQSATSPAEKGHGFSLRPYQSEALDKIRAAMKTHQSVLACMATGLGKTVLFAHLAREFAPRGRILVLAHRDELIRQAARKLSAIVKQPFAIEKGEEWSAEGRNKAAIVISSIQTQSHHSGKRPPRMERFDPAEFSLVIADEAHHAVSRTWRSVIAYYRRNPELRILGVTATPNRADQVALGHVFSHAACNYELRDAVLDGWLVRPDTLTLQIDSLDFSAIPTVAGDLAQKELSCEVLRNLHAFAAGIQEHCGDMYSVIFTPDVATAHKLSDLLNRHDDGSARAVDGKTPLAERQALFADYERGRFRHLVQCGICTEGWDSTRVECVVICRPTKSVSLLEQMIGRGTRPVPGIVDGLPDAAARKAAIAQSTKKALKVLDFTGVCGRHKLAHPLDILGGNAQPATLDRARKIIEAQNKRGQQADNIAAIRQAAQELAEAKKREEQRRRDIKAKASWRVEATDMFDIADILSDHRQAPWHRGRPISEAMSRVLRRHGIDPQKLNYSQAQRAIDRIKSTTAPEAATPKQAALLSRHRIDATNMSKSDASKLIGWMASHNWACPPVEALIGRRVATRADNRSEAERSDDYVPF